jgi:hypothetical protein
VLGAKNKKNKKWHYLTQKIKDWKVINQKEKLLQNLQTFSPMAG